MIFSKKITQQHSWRDGGFSTAGAVLTFVAVIAVGSFAYLQWGETASGEAPTVNDVAAAHESVESFTYDAALTADADLDSEALQNRDDSQQLQQSLQYLPGLESGSTFPDMLTGEISVTGSNSFTGSSTEATGSFSVSVGAEELSDVLSLEWRSTDGMNYLRSEALPDIGFFQLSQYENQWYSASSSQATDSLGSLSGGLSGVEDTRVSATTTKEIANAVFSEGLLSVDNRTRTELRSGSPAWQVDMSINPQSVGDFQQAVNEIITENHPELAESQDLEPTDAELEQAEASLEQLNNQLDQFSVWIESSSDRLRRVVLEADVTESEMSGLKEQSDQYEGVTSATFTLDVGLSGYNQSVDVQAPANAQSLQEAFRAQLSPGGAPSGPVPQQPQGFTQ
jgi:hypothetical protein